jgi:phage-related minor tail protein
MPRAGGGPTAAGTPYLVGERGPELFVPGSNGGVMSNNDLRSAMNSQGGGGAGSPVLNMSFESTTIGGVEYVSREQLEQAMAETRRAASRDGAQRGMTMTLDRIQNSSSTRRRIGV